MAEHAAISGAPMQTLAKQKAQTSKRKSTGRWNTTQGPGFDL